MGYNTSIKVIRRNQPFLDRLMIAKDDVHFPAEDSTKLAYKLREAVYACQFYDEYKSYYDEIWNKYKFCTTPGTVIARWMGIDDVARSSLTKPTYREFRGATSILDIVGAATQAGTATELFFPNADPEDPVVAEKLPKFCEKYNWNWHAPALGGITLLRKDF